MLEGEKPSEIKRSIKDFLPLIVIFALIAIFVLTRQFFVFQGNIMEAMNDIMAGFFLLFGIFKLLNWKGFADAYTTYDIIAKRSRTYAYLYPLFELALGVSYLTRFLPLPTNIITVVLMVIGSIGVARELAKGNQIMCACLGVVFKIPMTWVTFIEDVVMAIMATAMILFFLT